MTFAAKKGRVAKENRKQRQKNNRKELRKSATQHANYVYTKECKVLRVAFICSIDGTHFFFFSPSSFFEIDKEMGWSRFMDSSTIGNDNEYRYWKRNDGRTFS